MRQRRGMFSRGLFVWVAVVTLPLLGLCQTATWTGQVQCQVSIQSAGYAHQETQTWTLTGGAPTQQGAIEIYPATWTVTGQGGAQQQQGAQVMTARWTNNVPGMSAPIAIFVRASDGRLVIKPWHSQLSQSGSTSSVLQVGAAQTSTAYTVYEWQFPPIDDVATSTNVSGTGTALVTGNASPIPSAARSGTAACQWQFTQGGTSPAGTVPATHTISIQAGGITLPAVVATTSSASSSQVPQAMPISQPAIAGRSSIAPAATGSSTSTQTSTPQSIAGQAQFCILGFQGQPSQTDSPGLPTAYFGDCVGGIDTAGEKIGTINLPGGLYAFLVTIEGHNFSVTSSNNFNCSLVSTAYAVPNELVLDSTNEGIDQVDARQMTIIKTSASLFSTTSASVSCKTSAGTAQARVRILAMQVGGIH